MALPEVDRAAGDVMAGTQTQGTTPHTQDGIPAGAFRTVRTVTCDQLSALVPHANNVQIVGWIDEAARAHGDASGLTRERMHREGRMWFVARHEIDYLAESFAGDEILIGTWLTAVTKTTATRATRVYRRSGREEPWQPAVEASSRWVHMNLQSRRPTRIPQADLVSYGWFPPDTGTLPPTL